MIEPLGGLIAGSCVLMYLMKFSDKKCQENPYSEKICSVTQPETITLKCYSLSFHTVKHKLLENRMCSGTCLERSVLLNTDFKYGFMLSF